MRIFISWSGNTSHEVAKILYDWLLKMNIPALELFISDEMDLGKAWLPILKTKLGTADGGIFCFTKENVNAPWLFLEAGILCVTRQEPFILPFLFGVNSSEIKRPFSDFQNMSFTMDKAKIRKLVFQLVQPWDERRVSPEKLEADFERLYSELETKFQAVPKTGGESETLSLENLPDKSRQAIKTLIESLKGT